MLLQQLEGEFTTHVVSDANKSPGIVPQFDGELEPCHFNIEVDVAGIANHMYCPVTL